MNEYQRESSELLIEAEATGKLSNQTWTTNLFITEGRKTITKNNLQHYVNYISLLMLFKPRSNGFSDTLT